MLVAAAVEKEHAPARRAALAPARVRGQHPLWAPVFAGPAFYWEHESVRAEQLVEVGLAAVSAGAQAAQALVDALLGVLARVRHGVDLREHRLNCRELIVVRRGPRRRAAAPLGVGRLMERVVYGLGGGESARR